MGCILVRRDSRLRRTYPDHDRGKKTLQTWLNSQLIAHRTGRPRFGLNLCKELPGSISDKPARPTKEVEERELLLVGCAVRIVSRKA